MLAFPKVVIWLLVACGAGLLGGRSAAAAEAEAGSTEQAKDEAKEEAKETKTAPAPAPAAPAKAAEAPAVVVPAKEPEKSKLWEFTPFGQVRGGYEWVQRDPHVDFVGRNSGFVLQSARLGADVKLTAAPLWMRLMMEGATDVATHVNTPQGELQVRMRDAFMRYDILPQLGVQVGQFKAPWAAEELLDYHQLLFASRAVAQAGVLPGRGYQQQSIALDRQIGLMLSPAKRIELGPVGLAYYAMVMNGNGPNQLLNDNNSVGFVGRLEASWQKYVILGGSAYNNKRTVGELPNLYNENDVGFATDLQVRVAGLELMAQYAQVNTKYPTVGAHDRTQVGYHAQAGYIIDIVGVKVEPAYRYAHFDPWARSRVSPTGENYTTYKIDYHTFGVKVFHKTVPFIGYINYTLTREPEARRLANDRLELIGHVYF